jgi:hypothetical protein
MHNRGNFPIKLHYLNHQCQCSVGGHYIIANRNRRAAPYADSGMNAPMTMPLNGWYAPRTCEQCSSTFFAPHW